MQDDPNIMKRSETSSPRGVMMVAAGFLTMILGMGMGSHMADARADRAVVHGTRRDLILHLARSAPRPMRQAAMAAMADGVLTVREERHLYMVADQIRRIEALHARQRHEEETGEGSAARRPHPSEMI